MNATETIEAAIEADERRAARDSYRAAGGSKRRPLKSFSTAAEKRAARDEHAARLRLACEQLTERNGFDTWVEAMALNPALTPLNAALAALQTPGEIVGTSTAWKRQGYRVRKGERAAGRITGKGFWPLAYFTAEQAGATDLLEFEPVLPAETTITAAFDRLAQRLASGEKATDAVRGVADGLL